MVQRSRSARAFAMVLSLLVLVITVPFSPAETLAASPLGAIVTANKVTVGNAAAPTGTTIFAGDRVVSDGPALVNLNGGSRVEMTKATATFNRQEGALVLQAEKGVLRFTFVKGENVQIKAGNYTFTSANDSAHIGELGINGNGQIVMKVKEGVFSAINTETGIRSEASPNHPIAVGKGGGGVLTSPLMPLIDLIGAELGVGLYQATKSP
jgi:hypothetical protein